MMMLKKLAALGRLLASAGPERLVAKRWLLSTSSMVERRFNAGGKAVVEKDDDFQYVTLRGRTFPWPKNAPIEGLLLVLAELLDEDHPHHYLTAETPIRRGDVLIDIGACEGAFSAMASQAGAKPICVEPSNLNGKVITRLFDLWSLPKPTIVQALLGDQLGVASFVDNAANPGASRSTGESTIGSYPVQMLTLDELVARSGLDRVDFIKCDAEGADVTIMKSGMETFRKFHPRVSVTTYHADDHFALLYELFRGLGYRVKGKGFMYANGRLRVLMLHAW